MLDVVRAAFKTFNQAQTLLCCLVVSYCSRCALIYLSHDWHQTHSRQFCLYLVITLAHAVMNVFSALAKRVN